MIITARFHIAVGGSSVDEDVELEVPDEFFSWDQAKQEEYIQSDYEMWASSNSDQGFSIHRGSGTEDLENLPN